MTDCWVEAHRNPCGPGDSRTTAKQIIEAEALQGQWRGKTILVTGCSSGLGIEVAHALALTGAKLYLTARDIDKAREALGQLVDSDLVHLLKLDLNSLSDVRPLKAASSPAFNSRIVILSSIAHRFGSVNFENINFDGAYDAAAAYSQSKTANLWTANALERRFAKDGIHTWSVQPGGVATGLMQHMDTATLKALGDDPFLKKIFKNPEQGAATETWAAVSKALEGKGGRYLEDCQIIGAWKEGDNAYGPGYGAHAYNETDEEKLWALSKKFVDFSA